MHQIVRGNANDDKSNRPSPLAMFFPAIGYAQRLHTQLTEPRAIETAELVVGFLDCAVTPRPLRLPLRLRDIWTAPTLTSY